MDTSSPEPTTTERNEVAFEPPPGLEFTSNDTSERARAPRGGSQRWLVIGLTVALVAAAVGAIVLRGGPSDRAEAIAFRYGFAAGDERAYDMTMHMKMAAEGVPEAEGDFEGTLRATIAMKVVEVNEDGSAVVDVTIANVEMSGTFPPDESLQQGATFRMTVAANGEVLSVEGSTGIFGMGGLGSLGEGSDPTESGSSQLFFPQFPDRAIAPGDGWTETHEVPFPMGEGETLSIEVKGTHEGFEDTEFGRAAKIRQRIHFPMDLEFPIGQLFAAFAQGFAQGGAASQVPAGLENAKMVFDGKMDMDALGLVIPEQSDVVKLTGDIAMDIGVKMVGFPAEFSQGMPDDMRVRGTMSLEMVRVL